jgi:carboxymethylenebutenolidase
MKQEIINLFDAYTHALISRGTFLRKLALLAGGTAAAATLLPQLENNYANANLVAEDDDRLGTEIIRYPGIKSIVRGYLARPQGVTEPLPAVIVIHENRGLNPYIQDVARRVALAGYVALAPDFLSPVGSTPADPDRARDLIATLDRAETLGNAQAALTFLQRHSATTDQVGCIGFCWGGALTNDLAIRAPALRAAVPFYGSVPAVEEVPNIQAPLLLHYAGLDDRINEGIPRYEAALRAAGKEYTICFYSNVNHAFHNDTNAARYDESAAELAWQRTIAFLDYYLKAPTA